jgi:hypothetical protein
MPSSKTPEDAKPARSGCGLNVGRLIHPAERQSRSDVRRTLGFGERGEPAQYGGRFTQLESEVAADGEIILDGLG